MRIHVYGAAGDVTGSCYLIETAKSRVLVDCGLFQGEADLPEKNVVPKGLDVSKLDAVVLTHAHNDHTGRLPLLVKAGYKNEIYGTAPTAQLTRLILRTQLTCRRLTRSEKTASGNVTTNHPSNRSTPSSMWKSYPVCLGFILTMLRSA